jgi:hypothetical protein
MTLKRHLAQLQLQQEADLACLRIQTRTALRAASPRKLIKKHPYICTGAAIFIGMKLAPAPRRAASSPTPGSAKKKSFFASVTGWLPMLLPLLGNVMPTVPPAASSEAGSQPNPGPVTMPSSVLSLVQGVHLLLSVFESGAKAQSKHPLQVIISDAGSLNANDLASRLAAS